MFGQVAAMLGTVGGKVAVGGAVTVASLTGVHAAGLVDVPGLPDEPVAVETADSPMPESLALPVSEPSPSAPSTAPAAEPEARTADQSVTPDEMSEPLASPPPGERPVDEAALDPVVSTTPPADALAAPTSTPVSTPSPSPTPTTPILVSDPVEAAEVDPVAAERARLIAQQAAAEKLIFIELESMVSQMQGEIAVIEVECYPEVELAEREADAEFASEVASITQSLVSLGPETANDAEVAAMLFRLDEIDLLKQDIIFDALDDCDEQIQDLEMEIAELELEAIDALDLLEGYFDDEFAELD